MVIPEYHMKKVYTSPWKNPYLRSKPPRFLTTLPHTQRNPTPRKPLPPGEEPYIHHPPGEEPYIQDICIQQSTSLLPREAASHAPKHTAIRQELLHPFRIPNRKTLHPGITPTPGQLWSRDFVMRLFWRRGVKVGYASFFWDRGVKVGYASFFGTRGREGWMCFVFLVTRALVEGKGWRRHLGLVGFGEGALQGGLQLGDAGLVVQSRLRLFRQPFLQSFHLASQRSARRSLTPAPALPLSGSCLPPAASATPPTSIITLLRISKLLSPLLSHTTPC
jgi:hypothetical protein